MYHYLRLTDLPAPRCYGQLKNTLTLIHSQLFHIVVLRYTTVKNIL